MSRLIRGCTNSIGTFRLWFGTIAHAITLAESQTEPEPLRQDTKALRPESEALRPESEALRPESLRPEFEALRAELPPSLREPLDKLGSRASPQVLDALILGLTAWKPLSLGELAGLTGRAADHLRRRNIRRLLGEGKLAYLHPDEPNHPDQRYVASDSGGVT